MTDREQDWITKYRAAIEHEWMHSASSGYVPRFMSGVRETVRRFLAALRENDGALQGVPETGQKDQSRTNPGARDSDSSNPMSSPGKLSARDESISIRDIEKAS